MDNYIYSGTIHIEGSDIEAMWTSGFHEIWARGEHFNGYRELIQYVHNKAAKDIKGTL